MNMAAAALPIVEGILGSGTSDGKNDSNKQSSPKKSNAPYGNEQSDEENPDMSNSGMISDVLSMIPGTLDFITSLSNMYSQKNAAKESQRRQTIAEKMYMEAMNRKRNEILSQKRMQAQGRLYNKGRVAMSDKERQHSNALTEKGMQFQQTLNLMNRKPALRNSLISQMQGGAL